MRSTTPHIIDRLRPVAEIVSEFDATVAAALRHAQERLAELGIDPDLVGLPLQQIAPVDVPIAISAPAVETPQEPVETEVEAETDPVALVALEPAAPSASTSTPGPIKRTCPECGVPVGPNGRSGYCRTHAIRRGLAERNGGFNKTGRTCSDCGAEISRWGTSGLCKPCSIKRSKTKTKNVAPPAAQPSQAVPVAAIPVAPVAPIAALAPAFDLSRVIEAGKEEFGNVVGTLRRFDIHRHAAEGYRAVRANAPIEPGSGWVPCMRIIRRGDGTWDEAAVSPTGKEKAISAGFSGPNGALADAPIAQPSTPRIEASRREGKPISWA